MIPITALFCIPLGLIIVLLAINVSRLRLKHRISVGHGGNKAMEAGIRAHGNAMETIPMLLVFMVVYELQGGQPLWLWAMGSLLTLTRVMHAVGMLHRVFILRRLSAGTTYILGILLPVLILIELI